MRCGGGSARAARVATLQTPLSHPEGLDVRAAAWPFLPRRLRQPLPRVDRYQVAAG
jgi:hypothetical protein